MRKIYSMRQLNPDFFDPIDLFGMGRVEPKYWTKRRIICAVVIGLIALIFLGLAGRADLEIMGAFPQ